MADRFRLAMDAFITVIAICCGILLGIALMVWVVGRFMP